MFPNIFADSLLETSWSQHTRRSWTTLTSFGLQAVVIGVLLLVPLLKTVGLPSVLRTVSTPISMGRPDAPSTPHPHTGSASPAPANSTNARFVFRGHIPPTISTGSDSTSQSPATEAICTGICNGIGLPTEGLGTGLPFPLGGGTHPVMPPKPAPSVPVFRTSSMLEGSLIRKAQPTYPPLAKAARIQGSVVLFAMISKSGTIDNLRVVSGHPMLVQAAMDAVKQWRYRPYILNQEPIEVETQITVNFVLAN
jgi:periplasmic protein TonB